MRYTSGETVRVGDLCWHAEHRKIGLVSMVIETPKKQAEFGVSGSGIFICEDISSKRLKNELYIAERFLKKKSIDFLKRKKRWR